ncbi:MAG: hypothetical protein CMI31_13755 [Opitutae bacterium]|jgi:hypothetical protein|nr:hypothetical protein [Opitutae bacterium]|tara:strand:- start:74 stop:409 length:336 start_codon:yes stop_codon:yes gene_type:complete
MNKKTDTRDNEPETEETKRWLDDSANVSKLIRWFYWSCALMILIDLIFSLGWHKHAVFADGSSLEVLEVWPGFYGFYGFVACSILVFIAKALRSFQGKPFLMRDEDYWDKS